MQCCIGHRGSMPKAKIMMLSFRQHVYGMVLLFILCVQAMTVSRADSPQYREREVPDSVTGALTINTDDLQQMISSIDNLVLIDTRNAPNLTNTINGALHITEYEMNPSLILVNIPDKQTPIIMFGESVRDMSNFKATRKLIGYGYVNVFWLRGGIAEWMGKNLPLGTFKQ